MLAQKQTLEELRKRFRLNIYEAKIWTALLSRGIAAASELADISGVPRSRCYDVLESLEKKGFIIMKVGKPIKYIAVEPEAVVDRVKKRLEEEAKQQLEMIEKLGETDIFNDLELLHKTGVEKVDTENVTDSVVGRTNLNRYIKEMLMRAESNVAIVTNSNGIKHKMKSLKKARKSLSKNKVKIKFYTNTMEDINTGLENVDVLMTKHDARFVSVDNKEILFVMEGKTPEYDSGVWIKSLYFVSEINEMFEKNN